MNPRKLEHRFRMILAGIPYAFLYGLQDNDVPTFWQWRHESSWAEILMNLEPDSIVLWRKPARAWVQASSIPRIHDMGVSENRGPKYSTLNSRILYKNPPNKVPLIFGNSHMVNGR